VANSAERDLIEKYIESNGMQLLGFVPYDEQILKADMDGESPLKYTETSRGIQGIHEIGRTLLEAVR